MMTLLSFPLSTAQLQGCDEEAEDDQSKGHEVEEDDP